MRRHQRLGLDGAEALKGPGDCRILAFACQILVRCSR